MVLTHPLSPPHSLVSPLRFVYFIIRHINFLHSAGLFSTTSAPGSTPTAGSSNSGSGSGKSAGTSVHSSVAGFLAVAGGVLAGTLLL